MPPLKQHGHGGQRKGRRHYELWGTQRVWWWHWQPTCSKAQTWQFVKGWRRHGLWHSTFRELNRSRSSSGARAGLTDKCDQDKGKEVAPAVQSEEEEYYCDF